jgi:hypothetical protein
MTGQAGGSHASSAKKRKKSAPVPPDEVVGDRIKQMKTQITGRKAADNAWTQTLRDKLDPDTVNVKLAGDRTFKTNQQWVAIAHGGNKEAAPQWSWYGVMFMLVPFGLLSGKHDQYPSVWVWACTKGCKGLQASEHHVEASFASTCGQQATGSRRRHDGDQISKHLHYTVHHQEALAFQPCRMPRIPSHGALSMESHQGRDTAKPCG